MTPAMHALVKNTMNNDLVSKQFSHPLLVAAYDTINSLGDDNEFYCQLVAKLSAKTIIDLGCGTGLLTCELSSRGFEMIGIEPSGAMLGVARAKPFADRVQWIEGSYEKLEGHRVDLVLLTSHVAQFFLDQKEWQKMLSAAYRALSPGGHIIFDSRPPVFPPYQTWPTKESPRRVLHPSLGAIDWYYALLGINANRVRYQLHFHFTDTDERVISTDELIFRTREELTGNLESAGFVVERIFGDWDSSAFTSASPEMIFVAARPLK
jgi:SAM-dependent methyltransferase